MEKHIHDSCSSAKMLPGFAESGDVLLLKHEIFPWQRIPLAWTADAGGRLVCAEKKTSRTAVYLPGVV